tara:strand:- start:30 stop:311 length:282 start_codon:yes stop_codon:yes gene_type:complete
MNKFEKKVKKQYPSAYVEHSGEGVRIMNNDNFIAKEFYMPTTNCEDKAWEYAAIACRTKQNFDRTHPMRMDLSDIESKINRIHNRKRRGRRAK